MPAERARDVRENGTEPEFVANHITRWENAGNGMIRVYVASVRGRSDRLEFSVVTSPSELAEMARDCLRIAADFHNLLTSALSKEITH
jgi:hypothetical protein